MTLFVFVCLGFSSHPTRDIFHSYGDGTITREGLLILTYALHLWPWAVRVL